MSNPRDVYLFKKDGSYEVAKTDSEKVAYYPKDENNMYSGVFASTSDGNNRELKVEILDIKTLVKVVNIDRMYLAQGRKTSEMNGLNWYTKVSHRDNFMCDSIECKFEINYAIVRDSPLYEIITNLESINTDNVNWRGKYLKQEDLLMLRDSENKVVSRELKEETDRVEDLKRTLSYYYEVNSKPTFHYIYTLLLVWLSSIFTKDK